MPLEVVCAPARLYRPGDGDSFRLLVNFRRRSTWDHAQVVDVRLRGYRAREATGAFKNDPELDPNTREVVRVSGIEATRVTTDVLLRSTRTLVEFSGLSDRGREICDVWVAVKETAGRLEHLGMVLLGLRVVLPGSTVGAIE